MKSILTYTILILFLSTCSNKNTDSQNNNLVNDTVFTKINTEQVIRIKDKKGKTVKARFNVPYGYERLQKDTNSYAYYLRHLELKHDSTKVRFYNGEFKYTQEIHEAIINIDVGKRDLQQCADAVMRLRAEYLYEQKQYSKIHFNYTNGFNVGFEKWSQGNRVKVKGNKTWWVKNSQPSTSHKTFRVYMDNIFMYAGSLSLSKELKPVEIKDMQIGDIFILGGSPGHAITIVDIAINKQTKKYL